MFIDVSEIRKAVGHSFHFDLKGETGPLSVDNEEISFTRPVTVSLDVKNTGKILIFAGNIKADAELSCSRCLEKYPYHISADFEGQF